MKTLHKIYQTKIWLPFKKMLKITLSFGYTQFKTDKKFKTGKKQRTAIKNYNY